MSRRKTTWGDTGAPHGSRNTGRLRPSQGGAFAQPVGDPEKNQSGYERRVCTTCRYIDCSCVLRRAEHPARAGISAPAKLNPEEEERSWIDVCWAWAEEHHLLAQTRPFFAEERVRVVEFYPRGSAERLFFVTRDMLPWGERGIREVLGRRYRNLRSVRRP